MAGSPFAKHEENAPIADVNVVPLADVSLVLLIILLVLSPMAAQSMLRVQAAAARAQAALPSAPEALDTAREPERVLAVEVSAAGYSIDGKLLATPAELRAWLEEALKAREDKKVFVSPELDVAHGQVVAGLEAVQQAGGAPALVQVVDPEAP